MPELTAGVHFLGGWLPRLLSGRTHRDGHSVAFETLQHDHDAKAFGFAAEGPSLTGREFEQECGINVPLTMGDAFGPCSTRRFAPHRATLRVSRPCG